MRIATKLWIGYGLLVLLLGGLLAHHISLVRDLVADQRRLAAISSRLAISSTEQSYWLERLEENAAKYEVTGDPGYAEQFVLVTERIRESLPRLDSVTAMSAAERQEVERLVRAWERFESSLPAPLLPPGAVAEGPELAAAEIGEAVAELRRRARRLTAASRTSMELQAEASARRAASARRLAWFVAAGAILLGGLVPLLLIRSISGSLRRLAEGAHAVAAGDFDFRLDGSDDREFRRLAEDFNTMVERLGELDRMKRDFLSGISHDLKTPLASMLDAMRALREGVAGPVNDRQRKFLSLAAGNGERLRAMIGKILDLARMEAGALEYRREVVRLDRLAERCVQDLAPKLRERRVEVRVDGAPEARVTGDPEWLSQLLDNLLENAIRFAPRGTAVEVDVRADGRDPGAVLLDVADRGPGVPDGDKERIFERFTRGAGPDAGPGAGLGLTICREIVEGHGGRIWVEDRPGGGSVFRVRLPAVNGATETAEAASESRGVAGGPATGDPRHTAVGSLVLVGGLALLSLPACATAEFHRLYEQGRDAEAIAVYEADATLHRQERALLRAGALYALPDSDARDLEKARETFERYLRLYPGSGRRPQVELILALLEDNAAFRDSARRLRTELEQLKAIDLRPPSRDTAPPPRSPFR